MRIDTERKIEKKLGGKIRGPESPYNKACVDGLNAAFEDINIKNDNKELCKKAWKLYGCGGSKVPKLLYQIDGDYCVYK